MLVTVSYRCRRLKRIEKHFTTKQWIRSFLFAWRLLLHETAVATKTYWVVCWMSYVPFFHLQRSVRLIYVLLFSCCFTLTLHSLSPALLLFSDDGADDVATELGLQVYTAIKNLSEKDLRQILGEHPSLVSILSVTPPPPPSLSLYLSFFNSASLHLQFSNTWLFVISKYFTGPSPDKGGGGCFLSWILSWRWRVKFSVIKSLFVCFSKNKEKKRKERGKS